MFSLKAKKTLRIVFITINGIMIENTQWDKVSSHGQPWKGIVFSSREIPLSNSFFDHFNVTSTYSRVTKILTYISLETRENPIPRPNIKWRPRLGQVSHRTVERIRRGLWGCCEREKRVCRLIVLITRRGYWRRCRTHSYLRGMIRRRGRRLIHPRGA